MNDGNHSKRESPLTIAACACGGVLGPIGLWLTWHYGWSLFSLLPS